VGRGGGKRGTRAPLVGEFKVEEGSRPTARSRGAAAEVDLDRRLRPTLIVLGGGESEDRSSVAGRDATGGHFGKPIIFVNVTEFVRGFGPGLTKVNGGSIFLHGK
jgi:hypothetical protein